MAPRKNRLPRTIPAAICLIYCTILIAAASAGQPVRADVPAEGYGVTLSSDAPSAGGGGINVYLNVTHADESGFGAFRAVLIYDGALVDYSGGDTVGVFTVDSSVPDTLTVGMTGARTDIGDGHELTLSFTAKAAGSGKS